MTHIEVVELTDAERRYPLATRRGIELFSWLVAEADRTVKVVCQGVDRGCGWSGRRKGGYLLGADKPCPKCGSSVAVERVLDNGRFLR